MSYWTMEETKEGFPVAALYHDKKLICKAYLSPDLEVLRLVLPEMQLLKQLKIDVSNHLVDFKRNP